VADISCKGIENHLEVLLLENNQTIVKERRVNALPLIERNNTIPHTGARDARKQECKMRAKSR
jgi:hypothetical protein